MWRSIAHKNPGRRPARSGVLAVAPFQHREGRKLFTHRDIPDSDALQKFGLISTPAPRYAGLPLDFRPPERYEAPVWWEGPRCGECGGGGGFNGDNILHQFWRDLHHDDDPFIVRLVHEHVRVGNEVRRSAWPEVSTITGVRLSSLQLQRFAGLLKRADELLYAA